MVRFSTVQARTRGNIYKKHILHGMGARLISFIFNTNSRDA